MIELLFGIVIGVSVTWIYVSIRLYQFGWTWEMITGKIKQDTLQDYLNRKYGSYEIDPVNFKGGEFDRDKRTE